MEALLLIKQTLAHLAADFVLQPTSWIREKEVKLLKSPYFWLHLVIVTILSYVVVGDWNDWIIPVTIGMTHGLIDLGKAWLSRQIPWSRYSVPLFLIDQSLHVGVLVGIWYFYTIPEGGFMPVFFVYEREFWILLTAIVTLTTPAGIIIGKIVEPFRKDIGTEDSLKNAGTYIGIFERLLILIFILVNQFAAVGFLLASKSILRISRDSDAEVRKKTEYVLVGTLLSFFTAIVVGILAKYLLK